MGRIRVAFVDSEASVVFFLVQSQPNYGCCTELKKLTWLFTLLAQKLKLNSSVSSSIFHLLFPQRERMREREECRIFLSFIPTPEISSRIISLIALNLAMMNGRSLKLEIHRFIGVTKLAFYEIFDHFRQFSNRKREQDTCLFTHRHTQYTFHSLYH